VRLDQWALGHWARRQWAAVTEREGRRRWGEWAALEWEGRGAERACRQSRTER
jgi:hypothetical protein